MSLPTLPSSPSVGASESSLPNSIARLFNDPSRLCCPITQDLFIDPVFVDGFNFERSEIESWFSSGRITNPRTNSEVSSRFRENLQSNFDKKSEVEAWRVKKARRCLEIEDLAFRVRCLERGKQLLEIHPSVEEPSDDDEEPKKIRILDVGLYILIIRGLYETNPDGSNLVKLCEFLARQKAWEDILDLLSEHSELKRSSRLLSFWIDSCVALQEDEEEGEEEKDRHGTPLSNLHLLLSRLYFQEGCWRKFEKQLCHSVPLWNVSEEILSMVEESRDLGEAPYMSTEDYLQWIMQVKLAHREYAAAKEVILRRKVDPATEIRLLGFLQEQLIHANQLVEAARISVYLSRLCPDEEEKLSILERAYQMAPLDFEVMHEMFDVLRGLWLNREESQIARKTDEMTQELDALRAKVMRKDAEASQLAVQMEAMKAELRTLREENFRLGRSSPDHWRQSIFGQRRQ